MRKIPEIIVAVDEAGGFGKAGKIPWSLPEDLAHFKELTKGHVCVMGRYTYEDLLDARKQRDAAKGITDPITEILRDRESYVVTRNQTYQVEGAARVDDLGVAMNRMELVGDPRTLFVLGGRRMFIQALSWTTKIHMTIVKGKEYDCDVFFPIDVLNRKFKIVSGRETEKAYYVVYQRTK